MAVNTDPHDIPFTSYTFGVDLADPMVAQLRAYVQAQGVSHGNITVTTSDNTGNVTITNPTYTSGDGTVATDTIHLNPRSVQTPPQVGERRPILRVVEPPNWRGGQHPIPGWNEWHDPPRDGDEPFGARYDELINRFGVRRQDVDLPEGTEMLKCCQIEEVVGEDVKLEFHIKGPTIPKALLDKIPPEMFKVLDLEIKRAMIRAFRLTPTEELRKRTIIVDEEE